MSVVQLFSASRTLYSDGVATEFTIDLSKELSQSKYKGHIASVLQAVINSSSAGTLTPTATVTQGNTVKFTFSSAIPGNGTLAGGYVTVDLSLGVE